MPAADETALVAVPLPNSGIAPAVMSAWEDGEAILPLGPALPGPATDRLVAALRPTHLLDADGRRPLPGGVPVTADTAAVVVTSGTTGEPKGVELTRGGLEAMGRGYSEALGAGAGDRWLACLPLHHVAGLAILGRAWVTGVPFTVHDGFDLERVGASAARDGTTIVSLVPTTLQRLLRAGAPLHEFRRVIVGGAPCPPSLRARAEEAGVALVDAYGLSETWGGCVLEGVANRGVELRVDDNGDVRVRGAPVMRGYRLDAAGTAEVLDADGWLLTGDVGELDGGRLRVVDRRKDLVISGGVNVSPAEVEGVLTRHPAVADVAVVGAPDEEWGERVVACVVPADPDRPPSLDELRAFARQHLAAAKAPRELRLVGEVPRTPSGKVLRHHLRERDDQPLPRAFRDLRRPSG